MGLINTPISNLVGGVSQQPPALRSLNEAEAIDNAVPSPIEGLMKRPPTEHIALVQNAANEGRWSNTSEPPFVHLIERDETEKYFLIVQQDGSPHIYDTLGNRKTLYIDTGVTLGSTGRENRRALTVGDVTFILNRTVVAAQDNTLTTQTPANYNQAGLVWIKQANYSREHILKLTNGGTTVTFSHTTGSSGDVGTLHVATALFTGVGSGYSGPPGGIDAHATYGNSTMVDGVIYLQAAVDFTAVVEDDFAGDGLVFIRDTVERFEDLPPTAPHNYIVRVAGVPEADLDDYWVQFKADNGVFSRGIWAECPAPGIKYKWDYSTLPVLLIRQYNGTFMLKYADGTTPTIAPPLPPSVDYSLYKWVNRLIGNDTSNPFPSFLNNTIKDIVFFQNRLGILSGDNVIFSEVGQFFNFFRTSTMDLLDSDVIDVASTNPRINNLSGAVQFNNDLILFTPTGQMALRGGEVLSPKSIAMVSVAEFDNQASSVRPVTSANSVFFTYNNGGYTGMRELIPQPALDGSYLANDLTAQVSRYIAGTPLVLASSTHDNIVTLVANNSLYCYKYLVSGNQRVQSAWFRFTFNDSSSAAHAFAYPIWAGFVESDLYMVMLRTRTNNTGWITIEKVRMGAGVTDQATSNKDWLTHLDQRKYFAAGTGSYNSTTGLTTYTLPRPMSYAAGKTMAVATDGKILSIVSGTAYSDPTAATISVSGNWSATPIWIGTAYTMTYQFSKIYLKTSVGNQPLTLMGRYQLRYMTLQYADSGYFVVQAAVGGGDTYVYPFTGEVLGTNIIGEANIVSGDFRVPLYSKNDNLTLTISNDSPLPCKILTASIEAEYNDRVTNSRARLPR